MGCLKYKGMRTKKEKFKYTVCFTMLKIFKINSTFTKFYGFSQWLPPGDPIFSLLFYLQRNGQSKVALRLLIDLDRYLETFERKM